MAQNYALVGVPGHGGSNIEVVDVVWYKYN